MKRVLLIGGPGSVIGKGLISHLLETGNQVVATYCSEPNIQDTNPKEKLTYLRLDVSDADAVSQLVARIDAEADIDVLINNAGIFLGSVMPLTSAADWYQVVNVNLNGVFHACKAMTRRMMGRKRGKIINLASTRGFIGGVGEGAYAASKAGVVALTKSLARECASSQISVNAVCPGFIPSKLNQFDQKQMALAREHALLDINTNLADVIHFIGFLCGDSLCGVTGQVFHIHSQIL